MNKRQRVCLNDTLSSMDRVIGRVMRLKKRPRYVLDALISYRARLEGLLPPTSDRRSK